MNGTVEAQLGSIHEAIQNIKSNIEALFNERKAQTEQIASLDKKVDLFKNTFEMTKSRCETRFEDVEIKLGNDYRDLNEIKKIKSVKEGIKEYKMNLREFIRWFLYVILAIFAIVISINTVLEIKDRVNNHKGVPDAVRETTGHP